ncbi:hypothetical protein MHYP_G00340930 [Metynnis hypsauchen]
MMEKNAFKVAQSRVADPPLASEKQVARFQLWQIWTGLGKWGGVRLSRKHHRWWFRAFPVGWLFDVELQLQEFMNGYLSFPREGAGYKMACLSCLQTSQSSCHEPLHYLKAQVCAY